MCASGMMNQHHAWSFDVASFMVLVGESEEFNYRLMQRSLSECLTAAPVAGLQSYIRSNYALLEKTGLSYFSPRGCTTAPLRNMRLMLSISRYKLLKDGTCRVYQIPPGGRARSNINRLTVATAVSWLIFVGIMTLVLAIGETSWIGLSACFGLIGWSIILRLWERYSLKLATVKAYGPDQADAICILGRRNSCFILQGSRRDVLKWTGQGLEQREAETIDLICMGMRIGSLAMLLYLLIIIPNGTKWDQVAFIMLNTLGQLNAMLGQRVNAKACLEELDIVEVIAMPTRTHIYAYLLRKFGNGAWVGKTALLPQTEVWMRWRDAVTSNLSIDPKELYGICMEEENSRQTEKGKVTDEAKEVDEMIEKCPEVRGSFKRS